MKSQFAKPTTWFAAQLLGIAMVLAPAAVGRAAEHDSAPHGGAEGEAAAPERTDLLELGAFRLRSSQVTDREVIDLQFALTLVLSTELTGSEFHDLECWKNRIRDQVIIAMRSAEAADFADPQLRRIQRLIMFRIRRLPIAEGILGVYVTDFSLDAGETMADLMVLPVTPSAPPKAPGGEGH
jgi:hypothetical protein